MDEKRDKMFRFSLRELLVVSLVVALLLGGYFGLKRAFQAVVDAPSRSGDH